MRATSKARTILSLGMVRLLHVERGADVNQFHPGVLDLSFIERAENRALKPTADIPGDQWGEWGRVGASGGEWER